MELFVAKKALGYVRTEAYPEGITVALDLGEHSFCSLESNCPLAVQMRRLIADAGLNLLDILQGADRVNEEDSLFSNIVLENITGETTIMIADQAVTLALMDVVSDPIKRKIHELRHSIEREVTRVRTIGKAYNNSYKREVERLKQVITLPVLPWGTFDLLHNKLIITGDVDGYIFLFQTVYHPQWLVHDSVRSMLDASDIEAIKRDAYLEIHTNRAGQIAEVRILDDTGRKLQHYHGNDYSDCWGSVTLRLSSLTLANLVAVRNMAMGAMGTINVDSLMMRDPPNMPSIESLQRRATRQGREGFRTAEVPDTDGGWRREREDRIWTTGEPPVEAAPPRAWGRR